MDGGAGIGDWGGGLLGGCNESTNETCIYGRNIHILDVYKSKLDPKNRIMPIIRNDRLTIKEVKGRLA